MVEVQLVPRFRSIHPRPAREGVGGSLSSIVTAIREREERLERIAGELNDARAAADATSLPFDIILREVRRRISD